MKKKRKYNINIEDKTKLFFIILFFISGIVLPSFVLIRKEMKKEVTSKLYSLDLVGQIIKGTHFEEKIYLPKHITKYGISFATYGRKNSGTIKLEIIQGKKKITEVIDVSKLKDNDYYYLDVKKLALINGEALLKIEGIDGIEGNAVSMHKTADIIYGELIQNGEPTNRALAHKVEFNDFNKIVKGQIIFFILSIFTYFYFLFLIQNEKKNNMKIYLTTVLLIFFIINIKAPTLTFNAQPFAEQVFNFMFNGTRASFLKNIFISDAGYWPLYQRLIGLVIIKLGFNAYWTGVLTSNAAVLTVALMVSIFTLNYFEKYGNIIFRFIISMLFGTFNIVTYTETHTFIDFSYMNIILLFLIFLIDLKKLNKKQYASLMILTVLLCISKSYYILLLPLALVVLVLFWRKLIKREKIFLATILISCLLQTMYIYSNMHMWVTPQSKKLEILYIIQIGIHQIVQQLMNMFYPSMASNQNILSFNLLFLFVLVLFVIFSVYIFIKNRDRESLIILILLGLIFGISCFNVISRIWGGEIEKLWTETAGAINTRHGLIIKISMILILILVPYCINKLRKDSSNTKIKMEYCRGIILFLLVLRYSVITDDVIFMSDNTYSDWKIYSKMYQTGKSVIPIEPYIFAENKGKYYMISDNSEKRTNLPILPQDKIYYLKNIDEIQEIELPYPTKIEYLYTKRVRNYNFNRVKLIGFDKNNQIVIVLKQLNEKQRSYIGFKNDNPNIEISKISFITENDKPAYVIPEIIIGEPLK